ncbi:MAG: glycosyltransferase family 2 protein [Candidatus Eisenbacteria bacterium]|nr:glycosyltransferase family 2 protein [Candidatus Eisenbacteria bacterium]
MSRATVSAVIPAHNAMPDVLEAVDSVLAQDLPVDEVVVVNDRSSDGTGEAVGARFGDRVRVLAGAYGSAAAARNAGWRAARGAWIAFLDADDLWTPDKNRVSLGLLAAAPHADWCFSDGTVRALDGREFDSLLERWVDLQDPYCGRPVAELIEVNFILTSSVLARRSALEALGGFDESLSHAEDVDLWIRLSRGGWAVGTHRPLVRYRARETGLSAQADKRNAGAATLFARMASDPTLEEGLRRLARRRVSRHHYRLALAALREGEPGRARAHLARSWMWPDFTTPVLLAMATSFLPRGLQQRLRGRRSVGAVAGSLKAPRRVRLAGFEPPPGAGGATP